MLAGLAEVGRPVLTRPAPRPKLGPRLYRMFLDCGQTLLPRLRHHGLEVQLSMREPLSLTAAYTQHVVMATAKRIKTGRICLIFFHIKQKNLYGTFHEL